MDREHADAKVGYGIDSARDGMRNVMELEIQENPKAHFLEGLDHVWAFGAEKLKANLGPRQILRLRVGRGFKQARCDAHGSLAVRRVKRDDEFGFALHGCFLIRFSQHAKDPKELAKALGIRQHHVSEMEKGLRSISKDMAKRILLYGILGLSWRTE